MNLVELKKEIERLISSTPYTKEEVMAIFDKEDDYSPDELFAYALALDYLRDNKQQNSEKYVKLEKLFNSRKKKITEMYL